MSKLDEVFDLEPYIPKKTDVVVQEEKPVVLDKEVEEAKNNIKSLIKTGMDAINDLVDLAKETERDRTYEVLGTLIKNVAELNSQVLDINKAHKPKEEQLPNQTINNTAIFAGTTSDILKLLKENRNES